MTAAELRKALEGVPDDRPVCVGIGDEIFDTETAEDGAMAEDEKGEQAVFVIVVTDGGDEA